MERVYALLESWCNKLALVCKKRKARLAFAKLTLNQLYQALHEPDPDTFRLLLREFTSRQPRLGEYMVIVYDDHQQYPKAIRIWAGKCALAILESPIGFLRTPWGCRSWMDENQGRTAYLVGVAISLPELRPECRRILRDFAGYERRAWAEFFAQVPQGSQNHLAC